MIRLSAVSVRVPSLAPPGFKLLLDEVHLDLAEHRIALIGANGSGKSTLLRLLNGLLLPTQGRVLVDGLDTRSDAAAVRRRVGFTFTDPLSQLVLPTPLDDVQLSLRARVRNRTERQAAARDWLNRYGLAEVAEHSIYDLSGVSANWRRWSACSRSSRRCWSATNRPRCSTCATATWSPGCWTLCRTR